MKKGFFDNRREQIEKDMLPACLKNPSRESILVELKGAAMVGACEERDRILKIIDESSATPSLKKQLRHAVLDVTVLNVLGWDAR